MVSFQSRFEQRGIERGIQRGEAAVLLAQLEAKFGPLSDSVREHIEQADAETSLAWSTRILTEDSVEEVLDSDPDDLD